jgi:tryptophan-rich sensory protein
MTDFNRNRPRRVLHRLPAPAGHTGIKGWAMLVLFLVVTYAASALGALATETGPGSWYRALQKPFFQPPDWLFAPVWTTLYGLMAIAAWLVWRRPEHPLRTGSLRLYWLQLVLNVAWTWLFFGMQRPTPALAEIIVLWGTIVATILTFRQVAPVAAWLLVPYLAWVSFATALNVAIVYLN